MSYLYKVIDVNINIIHKTAIMNGTISGNNTILIINMNLTHKKNSLVKYFSTLEGDTHV